MAASASELGYLNQGFVRAEEPEGIGPLIPNGDYVVRVESVELKRGKDSGQLGLSQELDIVGGDYNGRKLFRWNNIPEMDTPPEKAMQQLGFLKKDLRAYGIDIDAPAFELSAFLANGLDAMLDRIVDVTTKITKNQRTGKESVNTYINGLAESAEVYAGATSGSASGKPGPGEPGYDPFADE